MAQSGVCERATSDAVELFTRRQLIMAFIGSQSVTGSRRVTAAGYTRQLQAAEMTEWQTDRTPQTFMKTAKKTSATHSNKL